MGFEGCRWRRGPTNPRGPVKGCRVVGRSQLWDDVFGVVGDDGGGVCVCFGEFLVGLGEAEEFFGLRVHLHATTTHT